MPDIVAPVVDPVVTPVVTPPVTAWYQGKADDATIGYLQNRHAAIMNDPAQVALAVIKSHREAETRLGVPADQLLRVPTKPDDVDGWSTVYRRLGRPDDPKDYVLKDAKGQDLDASTADFLRQTLHKANMPKDAAALVAAELAKFTEKVNADAKADYDAKLATGKQELTKNWGSNAAANLEVAKAGARALGVDVEMVSSLEQTFGYAKVMEMFRVVGSKTSEGSFVSAPNGASSNGGGPMTLQQAMAKKEELFNDMQWKDRFFKQDRQAVRELEQIEHIVAAAMGA